MTADLEALRALAVETDELPANIRDQLGGWVLPVGSSAVVLAPNGHLSIVHTESLGAWAKDVEQLRAALLLACDEIAELRASLKEACGEWEDSLAYVDSYHRTKWGYDATLARLRARVAEGSRDTKEEG